MTARGLRSGTPLRLGAAARGARRSLLVALHSIGREGRTARGLRSGTPLRLGAAARGARRSLLVALHSIGREGRTARGLRSATPLRLGAAARGARRSLLVALHSARASWLTASPLAADASAEPGAPRSLAGTPRPLPPSRSRGVPPLGYGFWGWRRERAARPCACSLQAHLLGGARNLPSIERETARPATPRAERAGERTLPELGSGAQPYSMDGEHPATDDPGRAATGPRSASGSSSARRGA